MPCSPPRLAAPPPQAGPFFGAGAVLLPHLRQGHPSPLPVGVTELFFFLSERRINMPGNNDNESPFPNARRSLPFAHIGWHDGCREEGIAPSPRCPFSLKGSKGRKELTPRHSLGREPSSG